MCYYLLIFNLFLFSLACERSLEVRGVEDSCWTKNVEVIDRLQYTGKSILNFAKKKLGMEVEAGDEPQKCDYYNCIFQELKMLSDGHPSEEKIMKWIKNNIIYNHAIVLLSRVDTCSTQLTRSIGSNTFFSVEVLEETTLKNEYNEPLKLQGKCEVVAEYMKCMFAMEKSDCPVFQYP
ncbi:uncharacterized protein LOC108916157 isoform X2 [Anoplophora glabripennis]|uniref:uncharacterized protein LOC108916157 isoform X2 n=1 Tax=Anoplophora glabripennis TaxID=217634 RepID=UPI00087409A6|nr:uncharacterized protein LOC108916157 isoform X2 [Anoplophora glabripennis]